MADRSCARFHLVKGQARAIGLDSVLVCKKAILKSGG